ncbi:MAG: hypothetical protein M9916_12020 [Crocinitomicaceae bacterium]|nr:hypothetical protein [Crocinitomicaceae bacterium]
MAGGKETPRQKMIGMMYLVLTALLALNVSKSIIDAFVTIEENIQKANIVQADRGTGFMDDVRSEIVASKGEDQAAKKQKLEFVLGQMKKIDDETASYIALIDKYKLEILKEVGEKVDSYKDKDAESILWLKQDGAKPTRMNLAAAQGQDKFDEPMRVMGVSESIKVPQGNGAELWKKMNELRKKLVEYTGSYKWGESNFSVNVSEINDFTDNKDLIKKVTDMIDKNTKGNLKEDRQVLIDLYMMLTKKEKNKVHDQEGVHWVGMTFDHVPLVAAIAALSSLEQEALSARALALAHWKSKVSTGEYSFNKIVPLAYGDLIANTGDSAHISVMMAAFDSDNQPKVVVTEGATDYKLETADGQGKLGFKVAGGTEQLLKGTVAIKNKSGVWKTAEWEHKIVIMKPSGAISLPELNVLYRGYSNVVSAVASGFDQTLLTGAGVSVTKQGENWIAKPVGSGREASLSVSGKNSVTGKTQNLLTQKFRVSNLPDPELYWGASKSGEKGSRSEAKLFAKYPPEIPLNATFNIVGWEVSIPGAQGAPPQGTGGVLSPNAMALIKQAKPGMTVSFLCTVVGPDGIRRKKAGAFKL